MVAGKDQIYETPHTDISVFTDTFFKFQKWEKKNINTHTHKKRRNARIGTIQNNNLSRQ